MTKKQTNISIVRAKREQAEEIATLIMAAMNHECCLNLSGNSHSLEDFHRVMAGLVSMEESQYSYRNTLVAVDSKGRLAGICVAYDGKDMKRLRRAFVEAAKTNWGIDHSNMQEETSAGEYYIDSLAVKPEYRGQGIARRLLREVIRQHGQDQPVALLVDKGNPLAESLYQRVGFRCVDETMWGGHEMRHLQYPVKCQWAKADVLSEHYHDTRWGVPVHDDRLLFKYLVMECMSCGLSWKMMLEREAVFERVFAGFDIARVAKMTSADVLAIVNTPGMIRSVAKVTAMIKNAQCVMEVSGEYGSFDHYIWHFTGGKSMLYRSHQDYPVTHNELSEQVSADMKLRGFKYVGKTIIYSYLQAVGVINDHHRDCFRYAALSDQCRVVDVDPGLE